MRIRLAFAPLSCCLLLGSQFVASESHADDVGVHCQIDGTSFDGDADTTRIDYVIPPGGKPPRFRLLAGHLTEGAGSISVELKAKGSLAVGTTPLSQEPTWKSVVKLPKQNDSAITNGDFTFSHFDPSGDLYAVGTAQFQTLDAHHGQCRFKLKMDVVDLGQTLR